MHPYRVFAKLLRLVSRSYRSQNFLSQSWIPRWLENCPADRRHDLALYILSLSPHYFIYQWSEKYPPAWRRGAILEKENQRNFKSRQEIVRQILRPHLQPQETVLDFGCGPGWLAKELSQHVAHVKAVDISAGALACARVLNSAPNIDYILNPNPDSLKVMPSQSVDKIVSFAVLQHLPDVLVQDLFFEFFRILKPQGECILHIALNGESSTSTQFDKSSLLMTYRHPQVVLNWAQKAGFQKSRTEPFAKDIGDDVTQQHLLFLKKEV